MIELNITVKDENSKLIEKDTIEDPYLLSIFNDDLKERVEKAVKKHQAHFEADAPDIVVVAKMTWQ